MKIRGTPAHIAEKYISLARDAQSSGDPVLAENYLQHAEHYSRIIMAYREQMQQHGEGMNGSGPRMRGPGDVGEGEDFGEDDGEEGFDDGFPQPLSHHVQPHHPPRQQGYDANRDGRHDRPFRRDRDQNRFRDRDRHGDRDRDRHGEGRSSPPAEHRPAPEARQSMPPQPERQPEPAAEVAGDQPRRRDRFQQGGHEQPEFLRRPVRRSRNSETETPAASAKEEPTRD